MLLRGLALLVLLALAGCGAGKTAALHRDAPRSPVPADARRLTAERRTESQQTAVPPSSLAIINRHSHPWRGQLWNVDFESFGAGTLTISAEDQATIDDITFASLSCEGEIRKPDESARGTLRYRNWACGGTARVSHLVQKPGHPTLRFEFGRSTEYAYNSADWTKRLRSAASDSVASGVAANIANSDIVIGGAIDGTVDLNGDGDTSDAWETMAGASALLVVHDSGGSFRFAKRMASDAANGISAIAVDSTGRIVVVGDAQAGIDLNADGDKLDFGEESGRDIFVAVYDADGVFQWSKRLGRIGVQGDRALGVAVDGDDRVVVAGYVGGQAALDGDGIVSSDPWGTVWFGGNDIFVAVFASNGAFQWAKRMGGESADMARAVAVDSNNRIAVVGMLSGDGDLNGDYDLLDDNESGSEADVFAALFDAAGTFQWNKRLGAGIAYGAAFDSNDRLVIGGTIGQTADLNGDHDTGDPLEASGLGLNDAFISVFDAAGAWQWAKRIGGVNGDGVSAVAIDRLNRVGVTGHIMDAADLNSDGVIGGGAEVSPFGMNDGFLSIFNADGSFIDAARLGGSLADGGLALAVDGLGRMILAGQVTEDADLNGDGDVLDENEAGTGTYALDLFRAAGLRPRAEDSPPAVTVTAGGGDTAAPWSISTASPTISLTLNEEGSCRQSMLDQSYDEMGMIAACGGSGTEIQCGATLQESASNTVYIACADTLGNEDSSTTNTEITIEVDLTPPNAGGFSPAEGSSLSDSTPLVQLETNESGDYRAALVNRSYEEMEGDVDCSGDGTTVHACQMTALGADGPKTLYIACRDDTDASPNPQTVQVSYTLDTAAPRPSISSLEAGPVAAPFTVTMDFGEDVSGFEVDDITVTNGVSSNFSMGGDASVYSATITPTADGEVTVDIGAGAAADAAGNPSLAASQFSIIYAVDTDGDGTPDSSDGCDNDPEKTAPGQCGCGTPATDTD